MLSGSVHRLSHVNRYSSIPVIRKENVAEHTFWVAFYSLLIAKDIEKTQLGARVVNFDRLLSRSLLHDIDESHTGDFLRTVKYATPEMKQALDKVSVKMVERLERELGTDIREAWSTAKDETLEGAIVEVADFACVVAYVSEEVTTGNKHLLKVLSEVRDYLERLVRDPTFEIQVKPYVSDIIKFVDYRLREESKSQRAKRVRKLTAVPAAG